MKRPPKRSIAALGTAQRKAVGISAADVVKKSALSDGQDLPIVMQPAISGVDLVSWATSHRAVVEEVLDAHGGILFRGFDVSSSADFETFVESVAGEPLAYRERSTPRKEVGAGVYTSTEYPASQSIFLHNENSYQATVPAKLLFYCETPATRGGQTPLADCRRVWERIDVEIRSRFADLGVMYVRNLGGGFGLSWQDVFQTDQRADVEEYCRRSQMQLQWHPTDANRVRLRSLLPATIRHPRTGEQVWFNHGTFFHVSTLDASLRETLVSELSDEEFPTNTYYGDGTPIEPAVMDQLRAAYLQEKVMFDWQRHDILLLDNLLVAHAREPFAGPRRVLAGMAEPLKRCELSRC